MNPKVRFVLILSLGLAALISSAKGVYNAYQFSVDFQWSPAHLLSKGQNPYQVFLDGNVSGEIIHAQAPNYLHQLYVIFIPLGILDFSSAKIIWALLNLALGIVLPIVIAKYFNLEKSKAYLLLGLFLCSLPFRNGLGNGQHALFTLTFIILPFIRPVGGHLLQGLAFSKYSFAPPFIIYNALRYGLIKASLGLVLPTSGLLLFFSLTDTPFLTTITQPLQVASNAVAPGIADIMTIFEHFFGKNTVFYGLIGLALSGILVFFTIRTNNEELHLPVLCLISLLSFKHLAYDFVFLLPVLAYSFKDMHWRSNFVIWLGIVWFWFGLKLLDIAISSFELDRNLVGGYTLPLNFFIVVFMILSLRKHSIPETQQSPARSR